MEYRITWTIDLEADNAKVAAEKALEIQRDTNAIATVFAVTNPQHKTRLIDLYRGTNRPCDTCTRLPAAPERGTITKLVDALYAIQGTLKWAEDNGAAKAAVQAQRKMVREAIRAGEKALANS